MRSVRRLLIVFATILSLTALAPAVTAGSKTFHLEKTCVGTADGPVCTVTATSFDAIAVGSQITYMPAAAGTLQAVIHVAHGTATGVCSPDDVPTHCVFSSGTGRLTQFHLDVAVTHTGDFSGWFWDGSYWFGGD
jgi:hypothetical protein